MLTEPPRGPCMHYLPAKYSVHAWNLWHSLLGLFIGYGLNWQSLVVHGLSELHWHSGNLTWWVQTDDPWLSMDCQSYTDIQGIWHSGFKLTIPGCPWIVRVTLTFRESLTGCLGWLTIPGCPWVTLTFRESLTGCLGWLTIPGCPWIVRVTLTFRERMSNSL